MSKVSPKPDTTTQAESVVATTRIRKFKDRLPIIGNLLRSQGALIALIIVVTFSFIRYDNFDTITIYSVLSFNAQFGLIALGMTFVIMTGGIDLSVGGIAALASVAAALNSSHGFFYALITALVVGTLVGIVNGFAVAWMRVPPFIATLAVLYVVRGIALRLINDAASINIDQKSDFTTVGGTTLGNGILNPPLPFTIPLLLIAFLIGMFVLRYTRFGRYVLAIGGNTEAARLMGLPVRRHHLSRIHAQWHAFWSRRCAISYQSEWRFGNRREWMGIDSYCSSSSRWHSINRWSWHNIWYVS